MKASPLKISQTVPTLNSLPQAKPVSLDKPIDDNEVMDSKCFINMNEWIPHSKRQSCYVCSRTFGTFRRKHTCRMCGEVVCNKCSMHKRVHIHIGENKVRVCSGCVLSYRKMNSARTLPCGVPVLSSNPTSPTSTCSSSQSDTKYEAADDYLGVSAAIRAAMAATETARREEGARREALQEKDFVTQRAAALEVEVKKSKQRIVELEALVQRVNTQQKTVELSAEQEKELQEARTLIKVLQDKLQEQIKLAKEGREAAIDYSGDPDDVASKLRRKLQKMERQLQQAGINVVEDIPYEEAKEKIAEISKRMQEIGSSEVVCDDKSEQTALRKEYFVLEQQMEKYNTALVMTDEYISEQKQKEENWNKKHRIANYKALEQIRTLVPVNISHLSENDLVEMTTPSGKHMDRKLARKLKRTNVLELLRVNPEDIKRMHPSVIEGYRLTGLTLLERRALHAVLYQSYQEWGKQRGDELSYRKFCWYEKLNDALKLACEKIDKHLAGSSQEDHSCDLIGNQCPVKAELKMTSIYNEPLGFPSGEEYIVKEVLKGDPDGAGEKALAEAKAHASAMVANQRSKLLKEHYGMNVREISKANGAMDEMDSSIERMDAAEERWASSYGNGTRNQPCEGEAAAYATTLKDIKQLMLAAASRANMNMTGKRDKSLDGKDGRSSCEIKVCINSLGFTNEVLIDMLQRVKSFDDKRAHNGLITEIERSTELLKEIQDKNSKTYALLNNDEVYEAEFKRISWSQRVKRAESTSSGRADNVSISSVPDGLPPANPMQAAMLSAIKSKRESTPSDGKKAPVDMLAAIKARKKKPAKSQQKPNALLEAIKSRANTATNSA